MKFGTIRNIIRKIFLDLFGFVVYSVCDYRRQGGIWSQICCFFFFFCEHSALLPQRRLEAWLSSSFTFLCNTTNVILKDLCIKQAVLTSFVSFSWIRHSSVFVNPHSSGCGGSASLNTTLVQTWPPQCIHRSKTNLLFHQVLKVQTMFFFCCCCCCFFSVLKNRF